jgi:hypothetical protein
MEPSSWRQQGGWSLPVGASKEDGGLLLAPLRGIDRSFPFASKLMEASQWHLEEESIEVDAPVRTMEASCEHQSEGWRLPSGSSKEDKGFLLVPVMRDWRLPVCSSQEPKAFYWHQPGG